MSVTLITAALSIRQDEPAWWLREENLSPPDFSKPHRYQIITVVRDDRPAEFRHDMGLAERFRGPLVQVAAFGVHTVAELQQMAEMLRGERQEFLDPLISATNWKDGYEREADVRRWRASKR